MQGFDGVAKPIRVVQADAKVAPRGCGIRRVKLRALGVSSLGFLDFSGASQNVAQVVVIPWHVGLGADGLLVCLDCIVIATCGIVGFS